MPNATNREFGLMLDSFIHPYFIRIGVIGDRMIILECICSRTAPQTDKGEIRAVAFGPENVRYFPVIRHNLDNLSRKRCTS